MLGFYENFPQDVHKKTRFTASISNKRLQQELVQMLHRLNNESFRLEEVSDPSVPQCAVIFEFGIAEANNFNYLDDEETNKALGTILKKTLQTVDLFCAIRYHRMLNEKKTPLRFDYYIIRLIFEKNYIEMHVFHERGPRYMSPGDIVNLIINKINDAFGKKMVRFLSPLNLRSSKTSKQHAKHHLQLPS